MEPYFLLQLTSPSRVVVLKAMNVKPCKMFIKTVILFYSKKMRGAYDMAVFGICQFFGQYFGNLLAVFGVTQR